jgi:DNA-binding NtrC family response regulator
LWLWFRASVNSFQQRRKGGGEDLKKRSVVLIVDDDVRIRRVLSEILKAEGYVVKTVETGKQAIAASKKLFFNVALIGVRLPDMDGTVLIDKLKATKPRMIRILVTGCPSVDSAVEAVNKNADGYVSKPFNFQELLGMIEKKLKKQREEFEYGEKKVAQYIETRVKSFELEDLGARVH